MSTKPVKKVNAVYLLATIFLPIAIIVLGGFIGYQFFRDGGNGAVICSMCPTALAVIWWVFGTTTIWRMRKKNMMKVLDEQGFERHQTFYGNNQTVVVDMKKGTVAMLFFWNPFELYVLPASRINNAWSEDGAGGAGFLRGTSRVSFLFQVDGVKIRVDTFTSNQRWKMEDPKVLEGISKADRWVQVLEAARQQSSGV